MHQEADARGGSFNSVEHLLHIQDLKVVFRTAGKDFPAVDKISMSLSTGEHIALLGETGCGKSVLAMAIFGLLPSNSIVSGTVTGLGYPNLLTLAQKELNKLRGREMVMIPQNPHGSLNPVFRVGNQLAESVRLNHRKKGKALWFLLGITSANFSFMTSRIFFTIPKALRASLSSISSQSPGYRASIK